MSILGFNWDEDFPASPRPEIGKMPSGTSVESDQDLVPPHMTLKKMVSARQEQEAETQDLLAKKAKLEAEIKQLAEKRVHEKKSEAKAVEALIIHFLMGGNVGSAGDYNIMPILGAQHFNSGRLIAKDKTLMVVRSGNPMNSVFLVNGTVLGVDKAEFVKILTDILDRYMKAWMYLDRAKLPFGDDLPSVVITPKR